LTKIKKTEEVFCFEDYIYTNYSASSLFKLKFFSEFLSFCHCVESLSDVIEVARVKSSDRNTTVGCHVNGVFLAKFVNLLFVQAGVSEHSNLVDHVLPIVLTA